MNKTIVLLVGVVIAIFIFGKSEKMPSAVLELHNQDEYSSMDGSIGGRCPEKQCLTVYVVPWCPACKSLKPTIISLTEELQSEGIDVKVIVGKDTLKTTKKYASSYPFPVLLDPKGNFYNKAKQRGVPFFLVSNKKGNITNKIVGGYPNVSAMRDKLEL